VFGCPGSAVRASWIRRHDQGRFVSLRPTPLLRQQAIEKGKGDLGHSKIEITLNVYGHLLKGRDDAHKGTAEELATEILGNRRRSLSVDLRL
jgi:hypothetical protein